MFSQRVSQGVTPVIHQNSTLAAFHAKSSFVARPFHSTPSSKVHPIAAILVRLGARYAGRSAKIKWDQMKPEERRALKKMLKGSERNGISNIHIAAASIIVACGVWYTSHLETTPVTKRLRYMAIDIETICAQGREQANRLIDEYSSEGKLLNKNDPVYKQMDKITERLLDGLVFHPEIMDAVEELTALGSEKFEWRLNVLHGGVDWRGRPTLSKEVNAFVLPDGSIFVYTGIIDVCQNEDAMAAVLAHEMSHAICQHSREKVSSGGPVMVLGAIAAAALWSLGFDTVITIFMERISDWLINVVTTLPYSREMETEADAIGLMIAASACFDPEAASDFWKQMSEVTGEDKVQDWSPLAAVNKTHPTSVRRAHALEALKPVALDISKDCGCDDPHSSRRIRKKLIQMMRRPSKETKT